MLSNIQNPIQQFIEIGKVNMAEWMQLTGDNINDLINRNLRALENPEWLNTWLEYLRLRNRLSSQGLGNIISNLENEQIKTEDLVGTIKLVMFHQLAEEILLSNTYLAQFSGMEQVAIREKFQMYDKKLLGLQRQRIAYRASREHPPIGNAQGKVGTFSEVSLIRHEAGKKTRHIAVRNLLKRTARSISILKPCFMMSPMSVAQYLEPGQFDFDLVVMDEASQIRPEDALGAIARGKRLVVVGDPKQLPPTSFFTKAVINENEDEAVALEESESILESVIPMFRNRRLRWHYRSRHESLIAFSNHHFYDSNLIIFPSPFQENEQFGIRFKRIEKGRFHKRRNVEEAREVVAAIAKHFSKHQSESVGVVAMNSEQQVEIALQLDQKAKDDPLLADSLDKNRSSEEPLFIKNLENVQGDERDVIIISMTYGPEIIGGRTMQRFGPINSNVGWRRLNVLFTRSKKRMHIFSSMGSGDILISGGSSKGVQSLRYFLEYCETGHFHHATHTGRPADSDFEISVMQALADRGYECEPQLGVAGYYLDLAVKDPGMPERFLMGVECDGATYHSAKSSRDRDRLRQEILENLGWTIRRIWSTDWFKNPQAQLQPILLQLDQMRTPVAISAEADDALPTRDEYQQALELEREDIEEPSTIEDEDLVTYPDLKVRLNQLAEQMQQELPHTEDSHRLLRPAMTEALLEFLPCSKAEFSEQIPMYLRTGTDTREAQLFLDKVLEVISDFG
jgi:very-short-patch-repair endonuclease